MYWAHDSSFCLFSSAFSSPKTVPSCSASIASCSLDVSFASEAGLVVTLVSQRTQLAQEETYPPPEMILPRCRSISRYSSMVIVGSRWSGWNTCAWNLARSSALDGRIMKGRRGYTGISYQLKSYQAQSANSLSLEGPITGPCRLGHPCSRAHQASTYRPPRASSLHAGHPKVPAEVVSEVHSSGARAPDSCSPAELVLPHR